MTSGISQLIATQAQRNPIRSPLQTIASMQALKGGQLRNQLTEQGMADSKRNDSLKYMANVRDQIEKAEDPMQKQSIYQDALGAAKMFGYDTTHLPTQYDEQTKNILDVVHAQVYNPLSLRSNKNFQLGSRAIVEDAEGNKFYTASAFDPNTKNLTAELTPFPGGPEKPIGPLQIVQQSTGLTSEGRVQEAIDKTKGVEETKADIRAETEPGIQASIVEAKEKVKDKLDKAKSQLGQQNRYADALLNYNYLKDRDLDLIYGRGESLYPKLLRSQEGINMMARRDQLVSMLTLAGRGELKGQGPITDSEQGMLKEAISILSNPDIGPDVAKEALDSAMKILADSAGREFGEDDRGEGTIMIDANGNKAIVYPDGSFEEL